jgi:hypothetical protein
MSHFPSYTCLFLGLLTYMRSSLLARKSNPFLDTVSLLMEHVPEPAAALRGHAQNGFPR